MDGTQKPWGAWETAGAVGAVVVGLVVLTRLVTPGTQVPLFAGADGSLLGLFEGHSGAIRGVVTPGGLWTLLVVRALAGAVDFGAAGRLGPWPRRAAAVVYVVVVGMWAWGLARLYESQVYAGVPVVPDPGPAFELTVVVLHVTGHALVWFAADLLRATGRVRGAPAVWLLAVAVDAGLYAWQSGVLGDASPSPLSPLGTPATPWTLVGELSVIALTLAVPALWAPSAWPIQLWPGLEARSPADLCGIAATLTVALASPMAGALGVVLAINGWSDWNVAASIVEALVATCVSALVLVRYITIRAPGPPRWLGALAPVGLVCVALVPALSGSGPRSGEVLRMLGDPLSPGPTFAEAGGVEVMLESEDPSAEHDAQRLRARLAPTWNAEVEVESPNEIGVRLVGAVDVDAVMPFLVERGEFRIHELSRVAPPPVVGVYVNGLLSGAWTLEARDGAALEAQRVLLPSGQALVDLCPDGRDRPCWAFVIVAGPVLTNADVADVSLKNQVNGPSYAQLTLSAAGRTRLSGLTAANVGRPIVIMSDGHLESSPIIMEPINGGSLSVLPTVTSEFVDPAPRFAAKVSQPLDGHWVVTSVRRVDAPTAGPAR